MDIEIDVDIGIDYGLGEKREQAIIYRVTCVEWPAPYRHFQLADCHEPTLESTSDKANGPAIEHGNVYACYTALTEAIK
jgi:hypothetical protein